LLKELFNQDTAPHATNVLVGKLGDVLKRAVGKPLDYAINWGRLWSLWPVHLETACCSVEFGAASSPRYDVELFGIIEAFGSLRQCDLIVVMGTITRKMAPRLRMVYDQMPEPRTSLTSQAQKKIFTSVGRMGDIHGLMRQWGRILSLFLLGSSRL